MSPSSVVLGSSVLMTALAVTSLPSTTTPVATPSRMTIRSTFVSVKISAPRSFATWAMISTIDPMLPTGTS